MRDKSIDIAKGLGIILVVWGHQFQLCPVLYWINLFHMPLFFFLGGCFMRNEPYIIFLYKKIRTLFIPFLFFYLGSALLKLFIYRIRKGNFDFANELNFYSISSINYPLWFIISLFIALNIYYFIRKAQHIFLLALVSTLVGAILFYYHIEIPLFISQSLLIISFIYLGEKFYHIEAKDKCLIISFMLTIFFFIVAGIKGVRTDIGSLKIDRNFFMFMLPAICGISGILLVSRIISPYKISFIFQKLGSYSLFIFGLHVNTSFLHPITNQIIDINKSFNLHNTPYEGIINVILTILFTFSMGILLNKYLHPFFRYGQNDIILSTLKNKYKIKNELRN